MKKTLVLLLCISLVLGVSIRNLFSAFASVRSCPSQNANDQKMDLRLYFEVCRHPN